MSPRLAAALLLAGALVAPGCAAPRPVEPPRKPFRPYQLAPQPGMAALDGAPAASGPLREAETLMGDKPKAKEAGPAVRIDAALIRFAVEQRQARYTHKRGLAMPPAVRDGWSEMLGQIDALVRQPAASVVPLDAVRARVALEAELDMDREHYLSTPEGLPAGIRARALAIDQKLAEVRSLGKAARRAPGKLGWPIEPVLVTSLFGMRADPFSGEDRDHQGVDLKAEQGQLIQAAAGGVVVVAGRMGGHGLHVEIEHGEGLVTRYSHLSSLLVTEGMQVPARGPVGLAGSTGRSTGPHLHFEIWRDGEPVDPLAELPDPTVEDLSDSVALGGP